jgi:hypothetical protein
MVDWPGKVEVVVTRQKAALRDGHLEMREECRGIALLHRQIIPVGTLEGRMPLLVVAPSLFPVDQYGS